MFDVINLNPATILTKNVNYISKYYIEVDFNHKWETLFFFGKQGEETQVKKGKHIYFCCKEIITSIVFIKRCFPEF